MSVLMPEVVLFNTINSLLKLIKTDYTNDPNTSLLYYAFKKDENGNDIAMETINYFDQAVHVFINKRISVNIGYNLAVARLAAIHILLPGENSRPLTIGADEGYEDDVIATDGSFSGVFNIVSDVSYQIMISSENSDEVLIIYNFLKLALLSIYENLELSGIRDIKFGGGDVTIQQDLVPNDIFHRALTLSFFYESSIPTYFRNRIISGLNISGAILE